MNTTNATSCESPLDSADASHIAVNQSAEIVAETWAEVHAGVQQILGSLDKGIQKQVADVRVLEGKSQAPGYSLFTYRTFSRSAVEIDPIVVAILFSKVNENEIALDADISGESTGDQIETLARRVVSANRTELLMAAQELASKLACAGAKISEALLDGDRTA